MNIRSQFSSESPSGACTSFFLTELHCYFTSSANRQDRSVAGRDDGEVGQVVSQRVSTDTRHSVSNQAEHWAFCVERETGRYRRKAVLQQDGPWSRRSSSLVANPCWRPRGDPDSSGRAGGWLSRLVFYHSPRGSLMLLTYKMRPPLPARRPRVEIRHSNLELPSLT